MFFDSHCHLNDDKLYDHLEEVIIQARNHGVSEMMCIGYDRISSQRAIEIANQYDCVYASVGFHPTEVQSITENDFIWLESMLSNPKVKAIGEIGLDYYWDDSFKDLQKEVFIRQINLAKKHHLPISIHMREATNDTLQILKQMYDQDLSGVMHCYSGSIESAKEFIQCNMKISLGGPVTFKNSRFAKEVAKWINLSDLLIETDSPYLTPHPYRGKVNEPFYLPLIAEQIAVLREISLEEIAKSTRDNAHQLFQIK